MLVIISALDRSDWTSLCLSVSLSSQACTSVKYVKLLSVCQAWSITDETFHHTCTITNNDIALKKNLKAAQLYVINNFTLFQTF